MRTILALCFAAALTACASFDGRGLTPGVSTVQEVERVMGTPAERRQVGSETWLYFSRQPYGRRIYVARIGADGRLIGIEQRLTEENIARVQQGKTTADEVLQLLGPPWMTNRFARMQREVWSYRTEGIPYPKVLYVQFSPDRVVREVYHLDDPEVIPRNDGAEPVSFRR